MARTIVFGDVHGCYEEWARLLDLLAIDGSDRLVSVGDLICKGPSSARTLDLALSLPNLTCVLGNHELRFLACRRAGRLPDVEPYDLAAAREMAGRWDEYMDYIESWPRFLELPEIVVVHAGLHPGISLADQTIEDLTSLRYLEPGRPWYDAWTGPETVVFGHWAREEPMIRDHAIGLDTSCVYGGRLSAWILPDRRIASIPASRIHYAGTRPRGDPPRSSDPSAPSGERGGSR